MNSLFNDINQDQKNTAINDLLNDARPQSSFFFLIILSVLMATLGLLINSPAVIIGSMLIAPLLSPLLAIALGITIGNYKLINTSFSTVVKSFMYSVLVSTVTTWIAWKTLVGNEGINFTNSEIMSRTEPTLVYLFIAVAAGLATAYARIKPGLNEALPGTAIAVALVPPIATVGIGIATMNLDVVSGAFSMFVLNGIGIVVAAIAMFSFMNLYSTKKVVDSSLESFEKTTSNK